jgi:ABC-2 type transport system ATP-binding protein
MTSPITTSALTRRYGRRTAVAGLDLDVPQGSVYALVGPNGAGKTTTLKMLMNMVHPTGGSAAILGCDSRRLGPPQFAQIGYVSENQEMPDWMPVARFLDFLRPYYADWDRALEADLVRQFDLPLGQKLKHLSRGMRMKAALVSSLAYRPKLIVLDEPFSGLDALIRDQLITALLGRAEGTTILISSHDLSEIESFSSHVGYLEAGRLQFSEELDSLSARFREIRLTFDRSPQPPTAIPGRWIHPEISGPVLRVIDTRFTGDSIADDLRVFLPGFREITASPMPLRAIFVALAKGAPATPGAGGLP